ncbi:8-oxo-dGTP diphosphatase [uncultured Eubacterium sp.]|uniref:8-oxo-dGTP diphosphatase n=1 Tax=Brotomerdimonas butyrica TaxID=2981721 RepID=UPI0008210BFE|nr:8-oxo-dGTP diphosphatase [Brotomerdimonas butyrica]MCU6754691.1 8-oxo-dGTP diphosphatase [Brotomerdimonas butyrica]SCG90761.1 8-oxo-dGTP diphosphatase [uncultured Eubacterium sp.]
MARTERAELTVLCLVYQGSRLLLQNRKKEDWKGYTLPGGHVEPGKSIVETVIREMKEGTGLTIREPRLCGVKQFPIEDGRYLVFLFKADQFEGRLISSGEGEMEWVERKDLPRYRTVADFEELLRVMEKEELTEFQYKIEDGAWNVEIH